MSDTIRPFRGLCAAGHFSVALMACVKIATYSSIYVSTNLAVIMGISREDLLPPQDKELDELP